MFLFQRSVIILLRKFFGKLNKQFFFLFLLIALASPVLVSAGQFDGCYCASGFVSYTPTDLVAADKLYEPYCFGHLTDKPEYVKCAILLQDDQGNFYTNAQITKKTDGCFCELINKKSSNHIDEKISADENKCSTLVTDKPDYYKACAWYAGGKVKSVAPQPPSQSTKNGCYCLIGGGNADNEQAYSGLKTQNECKNASNFYNEGYPLYCKWYNNNTAEYTWVKGVDNNNPDVKNGCYCIPELKNVEEPHVADTQEACKAVTSNPNIVYPQCTWYQNNVGVKVYKKGEKEKTPTKLSPAPDFAAELAAIEQQKKSLESSASGVFNKIDTTKPGALIGRIIATAMGIIGSITLVMFIYGGILWMTAAGAAEKEEKARHILVWGSLGLAVIFASYAILKLVFGAVS